MWSAYTRPVAVSDKLFDVFALWNQRHGFQYKNDTRAMMTLDVFRENLGKIAAFNQAVRSGTSDGPVAELSAAGPFTGMTNDDFVSKVLTVFPSLSAKRSAESVEEVEFAQGPATKTKPKVKPKPKTNPAPKPKKTPSPKPKPKPTPTPTPLPAPTPVVSLLESIDAADVIPSDYLDKNALDWYGTVRPVCSD